MRWISDLGTREIPKVPKKCPKMTLTAKNRKKSIFAIFRKLPKTPFWDPSTSLDICPFELQILWGLWLALKSSQINFQLKRTTHERRGEVSIWRFWPFKGPASKFGGKPSGHEKGTFGQDGIFSWSSFAYSAHFDLERVFSVQTEHFLKFAICGFFEILRFPSPGPSQQKSAKSWKFLAPDQLLRPYMFSGSIFDAESIELVKPNFWLL